MKILRFEMKKHSTGEVYENVYKVQDEVLTSRELKNVMMSVFELSPAHVEYCEACDELTEWSQTHNDTLMAWLFKTESVDTVLPAPVIADINVPGVHLNNHYFDDVKHVTLSECGKDDNTSMQINIHDISDRALTAAKQILSAYTAEEMAMELALSSFEHVYDLLR